MTRAQMRNLPPFFLEPEHPHPATNIQIPPTTTHQTQAFFFSLHRVTNNHIQLHHTR